MSMTVISAMASAGYEARPGREAFGSLGGVTFRHLGVDYTVTLVARRRYPLTCISRRRRTCPPTGTG